MKPPSAPEGDRAYTREIERYWRQLHERPVILSPKDWVLVTDWHARGVPLALIEEAVRAAGERRREPPRSLAYIVPAVEEAWRVVLEGRRRAEPGPIPAAAEDPRASWRRVALESPDTPLGRLLTSLLARLEAGEEPAAVDERLDREIADAVDPDLLAEVSDDVDRDLSPFVERMNPDVLARTRRAAVVFGLRRRLGLPGLPHR